MENLRDILGNLDTYKKVISSDKNSSDLPPSSEDENQDKCPICGGKGWITPHVPTGHPDFGSVKSCQCRELMREGELSKRLLAYSNLGYLSTYSFENLIPEGRMPNQESSELFLDAIKKASDFALIPTGWLIIRGPHGSGKTHLAAAIANRCVSEGTPTFFIYVTDLIDHLRQSLSTESELGYDSLFEQVKSAPILILDGISSRPITPWAEEKLVQILNHRSSGKMPTVVTTTEDIDALDPFISSRFLDTNLSVLATTAISIETSGTVEPLGKIPSGLKEIKFDTFDVRGRPGSTEATQASLRNAFKTAVAYSDNPDGWLTFYSPNSGCGKTHLAVSIANEYEERGQKIFFAFVPELMDHLRSAFSPDSPINSDTIFNTVKNSPMLILDDLGVERDSAWSQERLYQIIVYRQNYNLPTVITTRTDFPHEAKQGSAIASRIQDSSSGQVLNIDASDFRLSVQ